MLEVAVGRPRARDVWRRLRFVIDQARAWSEAEHGGLRACLTWAGRQGQETARVAEAVLPETDTDALRILAVHAAKGLEFPVVILSGMSSRPGGLRGGVDVIWTPAGGCVFKLRKDIQTGDFDTAKPVDEQMDSLERVRLLYVACARARDHLIVSLHRKDRQTQPDADSSRTSAELLAGACADAPSQLPLDAAAAGGTSSGSGPATQPPSFEDWLRDITRMREREARPAAMSASQLEGSSLTAVPRPAATDPVR